ncbi:uncharacterized protein At1g66480 [Argentina anserina]|uniref:uncharacterized protein At1g66480 n=1 Tax=Argentina anserina TaxID=57926 RepID=UPI0021765E85|nr:uncharacterized protein At1g66480 [Potentilla anserina]
MGNSLGSKKKAKVMQISGETLKLKTPVQAGEVVKNYPGHVLLKSQEVKHLGIRAKPLEPHQHLKAKAVYFLVELPKVSSTSSDKLKEKVPRRVQSGINMTAKDRLESLMLSRRSVSDLSIMKSVPEKSQDGAVRLRMRLPKAQVEMLMQQSRDDEEAAEKIMNLCMVNANIGGETNEKDDHGRVVRLGSKKREKRVSFRPVDDGEIQLAVAA